MNQADQKPIYQHHRSSKREARLIATGIPLASVMMYVSAEFFVPEENTVVRIGVISFLGLVNLYVLGYALYLVRKGGEFSLELTPTHLKVESPASDGMSTIELPLGSITSVECRDNGFSDSEPDYVLCHGANHEYVLQPSFGIKPRKLARKIAAQIGKQVVYV
ncbi:MAG: hypothetical protein AAF911_15210 [Planctomycetota bacterium]